MNGILRVIEELHRYRLVGERTKRERIDKMRGMFGHHDLHAHVGFLQAAHDLGSLVSSDATRDSNKDGFLWFRSHFISLIHYIFVIVGQDEPLARIGVNFIKT